jgi:hypothetical protein
MNRNAVSTIIAMVALACVPVLWLFATEAIPPLRVIRAQAGGGNRLGPWAFTWALVLVGCLAALGVAWLAYSSGRRSNASPVSTKPQ